MYNFLDISMTDQLFEAILKACKENDIKILEPLNMGVDGGKVGSEADHQLNIIHDLDDKSYCANFSPAAKMNYDLTKQNAIAEFIAMLINVSKGHNLKFVSLVVPKKAVEKADQIIKDNIFIRYIVDHMPQSDSLAERWDILIKKVNKNA